jgi:Carboxypeptidase regulatory-like domain
LSGLVTDPSGAGIPNATVKATHVGTNAIKETKTTADGHYNIPYLDPGVYIVEATANGFQTLKRENIELPVADKVNLPLQLVVGQMSQEITVVGQQEVIDTASADRGASRGYEYRSITGFPKPAATGNTNNQRTDQNAIIDFTHVLSPTKVLDVRASFGRFVQTTPGYSDLSLTAAGTLGMTQMIRSPNSPGPVPPSMNVGDYSGPIFGSGTAYSGARTTSGISLPALR